MNIGFYGRLASDGIRKNKRLYIPYILTCVGMVMMFYIISFLSTHKLLDVMKSGGRTMKQILYLGWWVIGIFAVFFLFYTHSFLVRRRKKEFGLFNILGMGKRHLARVLLFENLILSAVSIGGGLALGILFSKFAELAMVNLLDEKITFSYSISLIAVRNTSLFFLGIFTLIFFDTLRQIHLSKPIELLGSETTGEKQPKTRWIMAALGIILIVSAYVISISIQKPLLAMQTFFVAVIMVIVGTYLLFIAASVALCKILRSIKSYYYRTNHFVSVSSMAYRMKRNGAGLATICILCTMVLVMVSSTLCLNLGQEKLLRTLCPRDFNVQILGREVKFLENDREDVIDIINESAGEHDVNPESILDYYSARLDGVMEGSYLNTNKTIDYYDNENSWVMIVISLEDYNRLTDSKESLAPGEMIIHTTKARYSFDQISVGDAGTYQIKKHVSKFVPEGREEVFINPSMYAVVPDLKSFVEPVIQANMEKNYPKLILNFNYAFDTGGSDALQTRLYKTITEKIEEKTVAAAESDQDWQLISVMALAGLRSAIHEIYGGLFFLGILLAIVFMFATVLIIYYKQISEGYEDRERFDIMQKVGMTRKEIKKTVNSQVLTVFFLPLIIAGLHLAFAFPLVSKILKLILMIADVPFLIMVTIGCFLIFGLLYIFVYRVTSRAYFKIVSDGQRE